MSAYATYVILQQGIYSGHRLTVLLSLADIADTNGIGVMPDMDELALRLSLSVTELKDIVSEFIMREISPEIVWWMAGDWSMFQLLAIPLHKQMDADLWDAYIDQNAPKQETPFTEIPKKPRPAYFKKPIPAEMRWAVWERDNYTCLKCGTRQHLAVDHIIPESKGGPTELDNLQTLCTPCNRRKYNKMPDESA